MIAIFALALWYAAPVMQGPVPGVVRGEVRSEGTGAPVPYAILEVLGGPEYLATTTDIHGRYVLRGVPPGRQVIRARHIDHTSFEVEVLVPAGSEVSLDITLELRPIALSPVTVRAHSRRNRNGADTVAAGALELGAATVRALEATPGVVEMGMAEVAKGVPGHEPIDPRDVLFVRGAAADLKLVLLDGVPVYAPFHLGGLINSFEPELLRSATLYLGGAPARYDGGISYVLEMETRAGRGGATHSTGALDLLGARAMLEGPVLGGGLRYLVATRAVHGLGALQFIEESFPYGYADGLVRLDLDVAPGSKIAATGFVNYESVELDSARHGEHPASWGNRAGSVRYHGMLGESEADVVVAFGEFETQLPIGGAIPLLAQGTSRRARFAADLARMAGRVQLRYGASFDHLELLYRFESSAVIPGTEVVHEKRVNGNVGGVYVDASMDVTPRVQVRGGMRADVFSISPAPRFAPRVAATWLITDRAALTLAAGRYRQYVRSPAIVGSGLHPAMPDVSIPSSPLAIARASHVVMALDQELGEGIRLGVEGFFKRFEGVPGDGRATPVPGGELTAADGQANASGVDLWVRRSAGRITGWLGYSLAWTWSADGDRRATRLFAGRQLLSAGLNGRLGPSGRFGVRVAYGAGLPYTAVPDVGMGGETAFTAGDPLHFVSYRKEMGGLEPAIASPDEPYLRLDAEVSRTWNTTFRGSAVDVTPYLKVLNALDRRDALFYHFDSLGDARPHPLAALPVLPVLGVEWRF